MFEGLGGEQVWANAVGPGSAGGSGCPWLLRLRATVAFAALFVVVQACGIVAGASAAGFTQQGPGLNATGDRAVALSGDGNTALIASSGGAAVFTRTGGTWSEQAALATPSGEPAWSVAISADGNTVILGDPHAPSETEPEETGAALVYTRSGSTWTQQSTLIGSQAANQRFGYSVALSADGQTVLVGAADELPRSESGAYLFNKTESGWSRSRLLSGSTVPGPPDCIVGEVAELSSSATTALMTAECAKSETALVFIATRSGSGWSLDETPFAINESRHLGLLGLSPDGSTVFMGGQEGIVPFGDPGKSWTRGTAIKRSTPGAGGPSDLAVSADGKTLVAGYYSGGSGAVFAFNRAGSTWTQEEGALAPGWRPDPYGGRDLAISADGDTVLADDAVFVRGASEEAPASYVALGDSYSSGEGNAPYEAGTDEEGTPDLCHRSAEAYGPLLDAAAGLGPMVFKACSGAVTDDLFNPSTNNPSEPAQDSWPIATTKAVTVTIGGNDAGFASVLEHCVVWIPPLPNGYGCSQNKTLEAETKARIAALGGGPFATTPAPASRSIHSIASVIEAIHATAPDARIVVGLYPTLFGPNKSNYAFEPLAPGHQACEVGSALGQPLWIGYKDARWLDKLGEVLDKTIRKAAEMTAKKKHIGVTYAPANAFSGHAFCDSGTRWFHPLSLKVTHLSEIEPGVAPEPGSFHPTAAGQLAYEQAFSAALG